ncbi:tetratricopeptide repeat protein [Candidatus Viridilinea mediisalina]|nr:tetratricopeptide repeat protein [Candidatus Viridilinea mediisalina]
MELFIIGLVFGLMAMRMFMRMFRRSEAPVVVVHWPERRSASPGCLRFFVVLGLLAGGFIISSHFWPAQADQQSLGATMRPATPSPLVGAMVAHTPTLTTPREGAEEKNRTGLALFAGGDYAAAEVWFQAAISADPSYYEPYNNLAFCLYERGDIERAIGLWHTALQLDPGSPDAHAGLATALWMVGQHHEAQQSYQRALELQPLYGNADWMAQARYWSPKILADSQPLRGRLVL